MININNTHLACHKYKHKISYRLECNDLYNVKDACLHVKNYK